MRRLGVDLRFWMLSYSLYLLAVFFPQSSTFRLLMPLSPLLGAVAQPRSRLYRACLVVAVHRRTVGLALHLLVVERLRLDPAVTRSRALVCPRMTPPFSG